LAELRGKRITTIVLHLPPNAWTPKHVHGGSLTAYVLSGTIRSQLEGGPEFTARAGQSFFEPHGSKHVLLKNPSQVEAAELLVSVVHEEGAALTTYLK
jgi:quercetin dioxygenase-like cupin family protein